MEDISAMINNLLSSPDGVAKLQSMASAVLGQGGSSQAAPVAASPPAATPQIDPSLISSIMSGLSGLGNHSASHQNAGGEPAPEMPLNPQMLGTIAKAMSAMNSGDKNTELLYSLKKHLGEERSKRVDDAARIMQLIKMLPMLKESGLFVDLLK